MTDSKTIQLNFNRQDFEDVYFRNNQGDIYWGAGIKGHFIVFLISTGILIAAIIYWALTQLFLGIPIFLFFVWIVTFYRYQRQISPIAKWKKQVKIYLNELSKFKSHKILLSNEALCIIQDTNETIIRWDSFTTATINDDYISLTAAETLLLPKKSMREMDYKFLKDLISDKLKKGQ